MNREDTPTPTANRLEELTDAELEAIAAGKSSGEVGFKLDVFDSALSRPRGSFGSLARRPLPGRGGRLATNVTNSGQGYA